MREQEQLQVRQQWRMKPPSQSWYVASEPVGPFNFGLIPSQLQVGREEVALLGTPQPLDHRNIMVVEDLQDEGEEEGDFEYSWSVTEAKDEAAHAHHYELDFDMGLFDDD